MLVGIIVAFVTILVLGGIPGIHLVFTIPIAPFVAGAVGTAVGKLAQRQLPLFGLYLTGLVALPLIALSVTVFLVDTDLPVVGRSRWTVVVLSLILLPYVWFGSTLGAVITDYLRRRSGAGG